MSETRTVKFWSCNDHDELLMHTEISEAVEAWADGIAPAPLPETVTVYGYAPMELPAASSLAVEALGRILEALDEEHGEPDSDTRPTKAMREAALRFAEAICTEYESWQCEEVTSQIVRVADHVPAEWLSARQS